MSSIRIHQDLYNFERRRKGFTSRQWKNIASAVAAAIAMGALCVYAFKIPPELSILPIFVVMAPFIVLGFVPIQRMPADKYFERAQAINKRGDALLWKGDKKPARESELSREYIKASKRKFFECEEATEEFEEAMERIESQNEFEWPVRCHILP